ncbi:MAG TPA: 50S ribosomal protein L4 [Firmicutes bacterium]|jgi:large subunit ribosomal protein L4|nr:50S ribosomal protein L4 [Bacillota bacterium]
MPTLPVYNMDGEQTGEISLNDSVFSVKVNEPLLHQAVLMQQASKRLGTAKAKTRSEVRGGGRKPWRQKGTGRARHGSRRSPLWTGGGIVFPPTPRDYKFKMPKKAMRLALKSALSAKVKSGELIILEKLEFAEPKTKAMVKVLDNLKIGDQKALFVQAEADENVVKSARNIPGISAMKSDGLNVYDILFHDQLVLTKEAVGRIEEALA